GGGAQGRRAGDGGVRGRPRGHLRVQVLRVLRLRPRPDEGPARGHAEEPVRAPRAAALAGVFLGAALLAPPAIAQDDESALDPMEPDFTVVNLPTTLRLPKHAAAFRLTHRFTRPLGEGDFGDLVKSAFGFDSAAQVGLEFRFGLFSGSQLGVYRTNDRAIDFFWKQDVLRPRDAPVGLSVFGAVEGQDNFSEEYSP